MQNYPRNSPQAAARLVALALIADGNVCRSEIDALAHHGAEQKLGLPPRGMAVALQSLCEDLLCSAQSNGSLTSCIDEDLLVSLLHDVDDPALQQKVIAAIAAALGADDHRSEGEQAVVDALRRNWKLTQAFAE